MKVKVKVNVKVKGKVGEKIIYMIFLDYYFYFFIRRFRLNCPRLSLNNNRITQGHTQSKFSVRTVGDIGKVTYARQRQMGVAGVYPTPTSPARC